MCVLGDAIQPQNRQRLQGLQGRRAASRLARPLKGSDAGQTGQAGDVPCRAVRCAGNVNTRGHRADLNSNISQKIRNRLSGFFV